MANFGQKEASKIEILIKKTEIVGIGVRWKAKHGDFVCGNSTLKISDTAHVSL